VIRHVVQFSTGIGSAEVARRVVEEHGAESVDLLTADTLVEDADNWRFAREVVALLGARWTILADGRTPNHLDTVIHLGFDWTEPHRLVAAEPHWKPWTIDAILTRPPYTHKSRLLAEWSKRGIEPPALYAQGFSHANCGGACVRGGQAQWNLLLDVNPERYREWEAEEELTRRLLGKNVSILRDRRGGAVVPLSLKRFRERREAEPLGLFDTDDWGACGCFSEDA
jgi:hypothetical protein